MSRKAQCGVLPTVILLRFLVTLSPHCELSNLLVCQLMLTAFHSCITAAVLLLCDRRVPTKVVTPSLALFFGLYRIMEHRTADLPCVQTGTALAARGAEGVAMRRQETEQQGSPS